MAVTYKPQNTVYPCGVMPTYSLALTTCQRRILFEKPANAQLMMDILFRYRDDGRYLLHGFAIMPVQVHLLLTPMRERTVDRCERCIKDEFVNKTRLRIPGEIWQTWVLDHRVRTEKEFKVQLQDMATMPERRNLRNFLFVHTRYLNRIDPMPAGLLGQVAAAQVYNWV